MAETDTFRCRQCHKPFTARVADRKRGWAQFCSKSCKAVNQTRRLGRRRPPPQIEGREWDAHKIWFEGGGDGK